MIEHFQMTKITENDRNIRLQAKAKDFNWINQIITGSQFEAEETKNRDTVDRRNCTCEIWCNNRMHLKRSEETKAQLDYDGWVVLESDETLRQKDDAQKNCHQLTLTTTHRARLASWLRQPPSFILTLPRINCHSNQTKSTGCNNNFTRKKGMNHDY